MYYSHFSITCKKNSFSVNSYSPYPSTGTVYCFRKSGHKCSSVCEHGLNNVFEKVKIISLGLQNEKKDKSYYFTCFSIDQNDIIIK